MRHWPEAGPLEVIVNVLDNSGTQVVKAEIEMYVSRKKSAG